MSYRTDREMEELMRERALERAKQQRRMREAERRRKNKGKSTNSEPTNRKTTNSEPTSRKSTNSRPTSSKNRTTRQRPSDSPRNKSEYEREVRKQRARRKKKNSIKKRILAGFLLIILILLAAGVAYAVDLYRKIDTKQLDSESLEMNISEEAKLSGEGFLNVALLGSDSREGTNAELDGSERTDSIMVASLNQKTGEIKIISVYRDTLSELDDGSYNKINAAYAYGGVDEMIATLNRNLDMDIKDYVMVNFSSLIKIIDDLGGVELTLTDEEVYWTNQYQGETSEITGTEIVPVQSPGTQTLNGLQATSFCRIRYTEGDDYRRTERQREVLEQIALKVKQANFAKLNKVINDVLPSISTSFSLSDAVYYAKLVPKLSIGETSGFPFDKTTCNISGAGDSVIATSMQSNVVKLHEFFFGADGYTPSSKVQTISDNITYKASMAGADVGTTDSTDTSTDSGTDSYSEDTSSYDDGTSYDAYDSGDDYDSGTDTYTDESTDESEY